MLIGICLVSSKLYPYNNITAVPQIILLPALPSNPTSVGMLYLYTCDVTRVVAINLSGFIVFDTLL